MADKPQAKKMQNKSFIMAMVVAMVISLIIAVLAGRYLWAEISLHNRVLSKKTAAAEQLEKNLAAIPSLISNYKTLENPDFIEASLPSRPDFPSLTAMLEVMAQDARFLTIKSIAPADAANFQDTQTGEESPKTFEFSMAVDGRLDGVTKLLQNLEASSRPIVVKSAQLTGNANALTVNLSLTTYYQDAVQVTPKLETVSSE